MGVELGLTLRVGYRLRVFENRVILWVEYRLRVFENRVLRGIFLSKRGKWWEAG
jgi:hypothetical protein